MKILIRNSDSVVVYAQDDLVLGDSAVYGDNWRDPAFNTSNATLGQAALPYLFFGGGWTCINGVWEVVNTVRHAQLLAAEKTSKWEQIKAERDLRKEGGTFVSGKWFHSDRDSRIQQLGLVLMGASVPAVQWKTMDGSMIAMSQALASAIFAATAALDMALFANAESHKAAMQASARPDQYDFSTGWPQHFSE